VMMDSEVHGDHINLHIVFQLMFYWLRHDDRTLDTRYLLLLKYSAAGSPHVCCRASWLKSWRRWPFRQLGGSGPGGRGSKFKPDIAWERETYGRSMA